MDRLPIYVVLLSFLFHSVTADDGGDKVAFILGVAVIILILSVIYKIAQFVGMCGDGEERAQLTSTNNRSTGTTVLLTEDDYPHQHRAVRQTRTTRFVPIHPDSEQLEAGEYAVSDSPWSDYRARFVPLHPRQPDAVQAELRVEAYPAPDASNIGWCVNQPSVAPSAPQFDDS